MMDPSKFKKHSQKCSSRDARRRVRRVSNEQKRKEKQDRKAARLVYYASKTKWSEVPQSVKDLWAFYAPQHTEHFQDISPHAEECSEKDWRKDLYYRHADKHRRNAKETRRREHLKRVSERLKEKIERDREESQVQKALDLALDEFDDEFVSVKPHALEEACRQALDTPYQQPGNFQAPLETVLEEDEDVIDFDYSSDEQFFPSAWERPPDYCSDDETESLTDSQKCEYEAETEWLEYCMNKEVRDNDEPKKRMTPIEVIADVNANRCDLEGEYTYIEELPQYWRNRYEVINPRTGEILEYGSMPIEPHGLEDDHPSDEEIQKEANKEVVKALAAKHPKDYRTGPYKGPKYDPTSPEAQHRQMQEQLDAVPDDAQKIEEEVDFARIEERNKMAEAVAETQPFNKQDPIYKDVLSTVKSAENLVPAGLGQDEIDEIDEWISHIENLAILSYQMYRADSYLDMFVAIVAYAKMYTKKRSIIMELYKIIDECTAPDSTNIEPHGMGDWTGRTVLDSWEHFKTNTIWKKVSYLITAAMSLTACTTKKIEWSPFGMKLVAFEAAKEQLAAVDVLDALVKTFVWFCEAGCQCIEQRSLAPLLYSDAKLAEYDKTCDEVLAFSDSAIAGNLDDLGGYEKKLESVIQRTSQMKSLKASGASALWLQNRYVNLVGIQEKLVAKRRNTDIRQKPDGWSITGPTKVGKSILADLTMKQSLAAQGYCKEGKIPNDRILTKDMFDKYDSTWTSDILGVFMDDLGNSKAQTNQTDMNHTATIIKFFNNVAAQAIKAELNSKGVVFIDFRTGVVTSNVQDLDARSYSNCPESILRRFKHVTVKVKEKYRMPGSTMIDEDHPDLISATTAVVDVWDLCIWDCHVYETSDARTSWMWKLKTVKMEDGTELVCKNIGLEQYLEVVRLLALKHKLAQESFVERAKHTNNQVMCTECHRFPEYCKCTIKPHGFELGDIVVNAAKKAAWKYIEGWIRPVQILNNVCGFSPVKKMSTAQLASVLEKELDKTVTPLICSLTPDWLYKTSAFQSSVRAWQNTAALYDMRSTLFRYAKLTAYGLVLSLITTKFPALADSLGIPLPNLRSTRTRVACMLTFMGSALATAWGQYMHSLRMAEYEKEFRNRRDALPEFAKSIRDGAFPKGVLLVGTLVLGLKVMSMWNDNRVKSITNVTPQGGTITPEDVEKQPGWFGYMMKSIGFKVKTQDEVATATTGQVMNTLQKNVFWAKFTRSDGTDISCNIFFPRKSVAMFPRHIFYPDCHLGKKPTDSLKVEVFRSDKVGGRFDFMVEFDSVAKTDDLDMVAAYVPNSPDIKTATQWLPIDRPTGRSMCNMMYRDKGIQIKSERVCVEHGNDGHKHMSFYGGRYKSKAASYGVCMAPLIAEGAKSVVMGFHIGGDVDIEIGVMQTLTLRLYNDMINKLKSISGVELSAEAVELPEKQYGKIVVSSPNVHPHAKFVRELTDEAYIDVLGSTRLRAEAKSRVEKSILSDAVAENFSVVNHWGAPRLKPNWKAFNATLEHIVNPSGCFLPSKLERARQDWLLPILEYAKELNEIEKIRPLTDKEAIMGVAGKRFLDALPMKTGMGFPIFGPKSKWFEDVFDDDGNLNDRIPHEMIVAEMKRIESAWLRGERAYPVTVATLKDEPTPIDKEKVRVFQAGAVALSLLIRKYFLPIARILSLNPILSESAVGVNAFSPQWEKLMDRVKTFSEDKKVIAWDYAKYDVRMNSQMTRAVWLSFIEIAEVCEYSSTDLTIMRNAIVDICHPLIDYNGTMLMAYNMNTSGNNLTVNVNGVAGSLYVRMGFFDQYPDVKDFRSCVAAMTYGDDFEGSVHKDYRNFNFLTFKEFLADHGMKITLPDKSEDEVAFMNEDDADFLKRKSVHIPEIGYDIGALNEMSIFKSLHANLASKGATKTEVAMSCIDGAMHEWFAHGREVYEDRRAKMLKVCEAVDLPMPSVQVTFDERVEAWKEKYL